MSKFKTLNLLLIVSICFGVFGCKKQSGSDEPKAAKPIHLSYANFAPSSTFVCVQMEHWKSLVEEKTGGKVLIDTYPGGTLLGAKEMIDGVINGQADIGCLCMAYQPGRFTITNALGLPLGIPNAKVGSKVLMDVYSQYSPDAFKDVKVLTMFTNAPSNIMSKKPISSLEDIKGVNLRASGGAATILGAWGANFIGMPMSDVPEALQKGTIDGLFSSLEAMKDFNYAADCKYVTMTQTVAYPFAVVMNKDSWNKLDADTKAVLDSLTGYQSDWTAEYMDNHVEEAMKWSKETHGVEVIELSPEQKTQFDALTDPLVAEWIVKNTNENLNAAELVLKIKTLVKKYTTTE